MVNLTDDKGYTLKMWIICILNEQVYDNNLNDPRSNLFIPALVNSIGERGGGEPIRQFCINLGKKEAGGRRGG